MEKTYIVSQSAYDYRGLEPRLYEYKGTFRSLLNKLSNVTEENRYDPFSQDDLRTIDDLTDKELLTSFESGNGDGQPYYMVWCIEDHQVVIGKDYNNDIHPDDKLDPEFTNYQE